MDNNEQTMEEGFTNIITKLLDKIDKVSIKNSLKDSLILNRITSDGVYFITISKMTELVFKNQEHMRYIEDKLNEVIGRPVAIHVTFENKDSYFTRKLENI